MEHVESTTWTREEDKLFETALLHVPENTPGRWDEIAKAVPGKTAEQVRVHYEVLSHDLEAIESGQVEIPKYRDDYANNESFASSDSELRRTPINLGAVGKYTRKRGTPWTHEEHKKFLEGVETYGKRDSRSISRNFVITRTPAQIAGHTQYYFTMHKGKRKLYDERTMGNTMEVKPPPATDINTGEGAGSSELPPGQE